MCMQYADDIQWDMTEPIVSILTGFLPLHNNKAEFPKAEIVEYENKR